MREAAIIGKGLWGDLPTLGKKKKREMVAKDKPEFQIYIMPYVFRFMYSFRHRHM